MGGARGCIRSCAHGRMCEWHHSAPSPRARKSSGTVEIAALGRAGAIKEETSGCPSLPLSSPSLSALRQRASADSQSLAESVTTAKKDRAATSRRP